MKFLLSFDKYKSTFTQEEISSYVFHVLKEEGVPEENIRILPLSDGGEGSLSVLEKSDPFLKRKNLSVSGPLLFQTAAFYLFDPDLQTAYIELALASGLGLVPKEKRNPLFTSAYGTGDLIRDAVQSGNKEIVLFLGGSSTDDAGTGILEALSFRFFDQKGHELHYLSGKDLKDIARVEVPKDLPDVRFTFLTDVENPLLGPDGAASVFALQKGASEEDIGELEKGTESYVRVLKEMTGKDLSEEKGSGAAGGASFSLSYFFPHRYASGSEFLFKKLALEEKIGECDVLLSGEGKIDGSSLKGKVLSAFVPYASNKRVVFLPGCAEESALREWEKKGIEVYPLFDQAPSFQKREEWIIESKKRLKDVLIHKVLRK